MGMSHLRHHLIFCKRSKINLEAPCTGLAKSHEVSLMSTRSTARSHLALFEVLARDVSRTDVPLLQERVVHPLARAHQPVHFQFLHAAVGAHTQLSTRGSYLGKYELLQLRIALENMPSNSACHLEEGGGSWTGGSLIPRRAGNETVIKLVKPRSQAAPASGF